MGIRLLITTVKQNLRNFRQDSGLKEEKPGGEVQGDGECLDKVEVLLVRDTKFGYFVCEEVCKAFSKRHTMEEEGNGDEVQRGTEVVC